MDLGPILQYAGENGPWLVVIVLLFRSIAKKDETIAALSGQMSEIAKAQQTISQAVTALEKRD